MNLAGFEINPGDKLEYYTNARARPEKHKGTVISTTPRVITLNNGKYRDSITINDIACGEIKIIGAPDITVTTSEVNSPYRDRPIDPETTSRIAQKILDEEATKEYEALFFTDCILKEAVAYVEQGYTINRAATMVIRDHDLHYTPNNLFPKIKKAYIEKHGEYHPYSTLVDKKVVRDKAGCVVWDIVWPIVQAELDKGRDKYEIAKELGISKHAMRKQYAKRVKK